ncbi:MAG TPA: maleylpyruvate isomerase N-terminal domain-containing protein [Candidatus Limnocylindrales bacterium]
MAAKTKAELLDAIREDQRFWRSLVAEVGASRFDEPGPMGEWTFADMAGHLAGWRNRTIARVEAAGRGEPEPANPWPADLDDDDRVNDWIQEQTRGVPPAELVAGYDRSYDRLAAAIEGLSESMVADPNAFPWIGEALGNVDFTGHLHEEHVPSVRAWLDAPAGVARPA